MRYFSYLLLACLLAVFLFGTSGAASESLPADPAGTQAASAVNAFAIDVYRQLAAESGNLFFSPYSISSAMAMTYAGARGDTAAEMAKALRFADHGPEIHAAMKSLQDSYDSIPEEDGTFSVANRLWLDKREKLIPEYLTLVEKYYGAGVETIDFLNAHERARLEINDWVAQKTRDKIRDLLQGGDVTPDTSLILVNAVYFSSAWLEPFDKELTREEPFHTGKGEQKTVPMMHRTGRFLYGENSDAQWIRIPYSIWGFYMTIFLPRENESFTQLEEFESKLDAEALALWMEETRWREAALYMPKFKDERRYRLADILQKLGMDLAFSAKADFSGMTEGPQKIDNVIHQAFIELDEERTEAAAATAVVMTRTSLAIEPAVEFRADKPFIYCLTDDAGAILFMGRMASPDS